MGDEAAAMAECSDFALALEWSAPFDPSPRRPVTAAARPLVCPDCGRKFGDANALANHTRATHRNKDWLAKRAAKSTLTCPRCGSEPRYSQGKFGLKAECCGLWSWKGKPLVDRDTHRSRIFPHDVFDRLWKSGKMSRGEAYRRLQVVMGMRQAECHIALMTAAQAKRVAEVVRAGLLETEEVSA